jgi:hypothetical protein
MFGTCLVYGSAMRTIINEPIKVRLDIDSVTQKAHLRCVKWHGRDYLVREVGMLYTNRVGRTFIHVFSVNVGTIDMRIHVDGETLHATLVEISDGLAD